MANKDVQAFVRELEKDGWDVTVNRGHYRARHPKTNRLLTFSSSPSCPYAVENAKRDIRRMERGVY